MIHRIWFWLLISMVWFPMSDLHAKSGRSVDIMQYQDVQRGMQGYGLSVFQGYDPQRFDVEVIGKIDNKFPHQGMILVRVAGRGLEHSGTVAGMSGSPIYIGSYPNGKLVGALSYAWAFGKDPIAGITPISNMLDDLDRDPRSISDRHWPDKVGAVWGPYLVDGDLAAAMERMGIGSTPKSEGPMAMTMPLILPDLPDGLSSAFHSGLSRMGMTPISGGGGGQSNSKGRRLVPGGSLGIAFMLGDLNMVGVGTVTHVEGDRLIGFGHPFLKIGATNFPIVDASIQHIMATQKISFKVANAGPVIGQLTGDFQASVVGTMANRPEMVPLDVRVRSKELGVDRKYSMRLSPMPLTLPLVLAGGIGGSVQNALPHGLPYLYRVTLDWKLKDGHSDTVVSYSMIKAPKMGMMREVLGALVKLLLNPYQSIQIASLSVDVEVIPEQKTAQILRVSSATTEVEAGETLRLGIHLRPYGKDEAVTEYVDLAIPADYPTGVIKIEVGTAKQLLVSKRAKPIDFESYLQSIRPLGTKRDLVVRIPKPGAVTLDSGGGLFPSPPPSFSAALKASRVMVGPHPTFQTVSKTVPWVLLGKTYMKVKIAPRKPSLK
ncbi:MAG: hypothetical protein CMH54_06180 [Myxococcales bacterium]|nr:hypothetical protein [Myxococcales bacterium]